MVDFVNWNPDPIAFSIMGRSIRWYSLCWCAALVIGYYNMSRLYKKQQIPEELCSSLFLYIFFSVLIGARLGHCLFYEGDYYIHHITEMLLPIKQTAAGWKVVGYEGLSSHGGVFGMLFAIWLYCRKYKINVLHILDNMGIIAPLSAAFIRLGNLFNSEIVGDATSVPWGFIFAANGETFARHPAQLYESLFYVLVFAIGLGIFSYGRNNKKVGTGFYFGFCVATIFTFRILVEFIKADQVNAEASMILNIGQLLSIPLVLVGFYCLVGGKLCKRYAEDATKPVYKIPKKKK